MLNAALSHDRILDYFRQRLVQTYGPNLFSALLVGARARGVAGRHAPYDVVLFLRRMRAQTEECERLDLIQAEMFQTFDTQFNVFPFPCEDYGKSDGLMQTVRSVGVTFIAPPSEIILMPQINSRAEQHLGNRDILCLTIADRPLDDRLTAFDIHSASVKTGSVRTWSVLLPAPSGTDEDDGFGYSATVPAEDDLRDPAMLESVTSLFAELHANKLVSGHADNADRMLDKIFHTYRSLIRDRDFRPILGTVENYAATVLDLANKLYPSAPETALCRAAFSARTLGTDLAEAGNAARHEAEVFRHLLNLA